MGLCMATPLPDAAQEPERCTIDNILIIHDAENTILPSGLQATALDAALLNAISQHLPPGVTLVNRTDLDVDWLVVLPFRAISVSLRDTTLASLKEMGAHHIASGEKKGAADLQIKRLIGKYVKRTDRLVDGDKSKLRSSLVVLMSGDSDFAYDVAELVRLGVHVAIVHNATTGSNALVGFGNVTIVPRWQEILREARELQWQADEQDRQAAADQGERKAHIPASSGEIAHFNPVALEDVTLQAAVPRHRRNVSGASQASAMSEGSNASECGRASDPGKMKDSDSDSGDGDGDSYEGEAGGAGSVTTQDSVEVLRRKLARHSLLDSYPDKAITALARAHVLLKSQSEPMRSAVLCAQYKLVYGATLQKELTPLRLKSAAKLMRWAKLSSGGDVSYSATPPRHSMTQQQALAAMKQLIEEQGGMLGSQLPTAFARKHGIELKPALRPLTFRRAAKQLGMREEERGCDFLYLPATRLSPTAEEFVPPF